MKGVLIFLLLTIDSFAFNFYDISSVMKEVQQTLSDVSYAANTVNYIENSLDVNKSVEKDMDYYRNPNNFKDTTSQHNINTTINRNLSTKIFSYTDPDRLSKAINNFIQGREIVDIQFSTTIEASFPSNLNYPVYSALIIYRR